jgi:succinyldiaminopimelate transaminase
MIDLSQGTPVDPTPDFIQEQFKLASNSPGYPLTAGTTELQGAIRDWARRVLGAEGDFDVLPTIGSKELVAWLPTLLDAKRVLYPEIAYPTYLVGGLIAKSISVPVGIDPKDWPDADLAWINSPSNPTGRVHSDEELTKIVEHSRDTGTVIASDECYFSFPATKSASSILGIAKGKNVNLLAVHSLSKRSNLAGYRAGFIIGDSKLIAKIREVRRHAGMIVPFPVQKAMIAALSDEGHVHEQAQRYRTRRLLLQKPLESIGFKVDFTDAGLYIWCTRDEPDWDSVRALSKLGILVTPGQFYGPGGARHIRVALTATDESIRIAAARISDYQETQVTGR